jgi:hypothetical protein
MNKGVKILLSNILCYSFLSLMFVAITNAEGGGTFTYKNLEKGQLVKIYAERFLCIHTGDCEVIIGQELKVGENLVSLSKIINGSPGKLDKNLIIDALIDGFDPNRLDVEGEKELIQALEKTTGENFGNDRAKWQEWWKKNKGKF